MSFILKFICGSFGSWVVGTIAVILAGALTIAVVQSARLNNTKKNLAAARVAMVDPVTKRPWAQLAQDRGAGLIQCRVNAVALDASIRSQNAAVGEWKVQADLTAQDLARARQDAVQGRVSIEREVRGILTTKPGPDACKSADALILEQLR